MMDYNEIIKEAQDIMSNLFEVEYYGANDVEEEQNNKIKRQGKDKNGNKVDLVSVQDELFPYEGTTKEQYNKKIIAKINDMIEGKATLEDLIQLVRRKKAPVSESEFTAHKGNPVVKITDKNYKVAHGKGLPGPFNEKQIGQYIIYNKDTDASYLVTPDNWKKSKIKRDLEREGKVFEDAIELLEDLIQLVRRKKVTKCYEDAVELIENLINEKHVFPKLAVEQGNAKYLEADKKNNEARRLSMKAFDKLNKKIKELKNKGIDTDVDIEPGVTYGNGPKKEYQQALKTADKLHDEAREADREFTKADNNQRKLRVEGNTGVVKREFEPVATKKGDNFKFKRVLREN